MSRSPLAVVTGAASGIGRATALRFLSEGFRVAALDRSASGLGKLKRRMAGNRIFTYTCDLADVESLPPLTDRIEANLGPPQALVNVVGMHIYADIVETTREIWENSLNVNLVSAATLIRGFVPSMKRVKGAAIVNISSRNALSSSPKSATYDASKAGLLALTRTLGVELGQFGIRVNAVLPGFIDTPIHGDLLKDEQFVENYLRLIPLNKLGKPEDIANIVYFLASDQAAFITGQWIVADGGQMSGQNYSKIFGEANSFTDHQDESGKEKD